MVNHVGDAENMSQTNHNNTTVYDTEHVATSRMQRSAVTCKTMP